MQGIQGLCEINEGIQSALKYIVAKHLYLTTWPSTAFLGSPEITYILAGTFAVHQGTLCIKKPFLWRALLRMHIQKASLKTFICQYVTQLSHFPCRSSALPKFYTVHTAFLHWTVCQSALSSASQVVPARELPSHVAPCPKCSPLSLAEWQSWTVQIRTLLQLYKTNRQSFALPPSKLLWYLCQILFCTVNPDYTVTLSHTYK